MYYVFLYWSLVSGLLLLQGGQGRVFTFVTRSSKFNVMPRHLDTYIYQILETGNLYNIVNTNTVNRPAYLS